MTMLDKESISKIIKYFPDTGLFLKKGVPAGRVSMFGPKGYRKPYIIISVLGKTYLAHRLAMLLSNGVWPEYQVDHKNGDGTDNRMRNLRLVAHQENHKNLKLRRDNSLGIPGVCFVKNRWYARISANGARLRLGGFGTLLDACSARKSAEIKYGYHKNHGAVRSL